jgi:hypothetical protein
MALGSINPIVPMSELAEITRWNDRVYFPILLIADCIDAWEGLMPCV